MPIKSLVKGAVQRALFEGPVYRLRRAAALKKTTAYVSGAREQIARIAPRPEHMRADLVPMTEPTLDVSVIVPVYNVEKYVGACLESVLSQELDGTLEVIAVIDGSRDGSEGIVRSLAEKDARLRVVVQENAGLSAARNAGIALARGRWIAFVDSDDLLASGHLAALLARAREGGCDVVGSLWRRMSEDGVVGELGESVRTHMAPWGRLYRREVWERLRFPVGCWYEDLITPCCIQPLFHEEFVDDAGYLYRSRPGSIVEESSSNPKALDSYWALEEMLGWRDDLGITYGQADLDHFMGVMGPTLMGRATSLDVNGLRALFSLVCDLVDSLKELDAIHTSRPGAWHDIELSLRERRFELWCLACASTAAESGDVKMLTAWSYYRQAMRQR